MSPRMTSGSRQHSQREREGTTPYVEGDEFCSDIQHVLRWLPAWHVGQHSSIWTIGQNAWMYGCRHRASVSQTGSQGSPAQRREGGGEGRGEGGIACWLLRWSLTRSTRHAYNEVCVLGSGLVDGWPFGRLAFFGCKPCYVVASGFPCKADNIRHTRIGSKAAES